MIPLSARELTVFELRCSGIRSGLVAKQLGLQRTLVTNAERIARRKLLAMYKEIVLDENEERDPVIKNTRCSYEMTPEEYANAEREQSDRYVHGKLLKGYRETMMDRRLELKKREPDAMQRAERMDVVASEKPPEDATPGALRAWKLKMIGFEFPRASVFLETQNIDAPDARLDACVDELYDKVALFGGATMQDIDDTFGTGVGHLAEQEANMSGGIFDGGGATAGGIFGDVPVPASFHDPGALLRSSIKTNAEAALAEAQARQLEGTKAPELEGADPKESG